MTENGKGSEAELQEIIQELEEQLSALKLRNTELLSKSIAAEEALAGSRFELKAVYDNSPVMKCVVNKDRIVLYANPAFAEFTGVSAENLKGGNACGVFGCIHALEDPRGCGFGSNCGTCALRLAIEDTIQTGTEYHHVEYTRTLLKDGKSREVFLLGSTSRIHETESDKVLLSLFDITDRMNAEKALHKSEERYRSLFVNNPQPMWIYDLETLAFLEVNQAAISHYGYSREEFQSMTLKDIRPAEDLPFLMSEIEKARQGKNPGGSRRHIKKNGEEIFVEISAHSVVFNGRNARHILVNDITENKRAKDLLEQTRQNYGTFFNTIDEFLFVLDDKGNIIYTNKTVYERLGYTPEEFFGQSILMVHPPDRWDEVIRITGEILAGETDICLVPIMTRAGIQIPVETKVSYGSWDGKGVAFVVTKDISKVKLSEEKFSKLFFISPSASGLSDLSNQQYVEVNEAFTQLLGFSNEEVIGKTAVELGIFKPDVLKGLQREIGDRKKVTNLEARLRAKNGDIKHVFLSADNISLQDKEYRFTVVHDITDRKKAEEKLRISEKKYRNLVENAFVGIYTSNLDGKIIFANHAMSQMLEYDSYDEFIRNGVISSYKNGEVREVLIEKLKESRRIFNFEVELITKKNNTISVLVNSFLSGEIITGMMMDISSRKKAEEKIRCLNDELEHRVAERTRQLKEAIEDLDSFSYSVSHDLQAPLRTIDGFSQVILDDYSEGLPEKAQNYFRWIRESAKHMSRLINDLLNLSRVTKSNMNITRFDLSALALDVGKELKAQYPQQEVELIILPGLKALGDPGFIRIALENLMGNAWKFTSKTQNPRIEFGTRMENDRLVYFLRDNGVGFNMKYADKLFQAFQRLHKASEYTGTGIGLAIVHRIITQHGGEIWAESEPGQGSVFYFYLTSGI